jgi:hypothetical protein
VRNREKKLLCGTQVSEVKQVIKEEMLAAGQAIVYSEPERQVMSRSGDVCVVALTDQWYINYGEDEWRDATRYAHAHLLSRLLRVPNHAAGLARMRVILVMIIPKYWPDTAGHSVRKVTGRSQIGPSLPHKCVVFFILSCWLASEHCMIGHL